MTRDLWPQTQEQQDRYERAALLQAALQERGVSTFAAQQDIVLEIAAAEERGANRDALAHPFLLKLLAHIDDAIQELPDGLMKDTLRADVQEYRWKGSPIG